jgi:hypothetical protein
MGNLPAAKQQAVKGFYARTAAQGEFDESGDLEQ